MHPIACASGGFVRRACRTRHDMWGPSKAAPVYICRLRWRMPMLVLVRRAHALWGPWPVLTLVFCLRGPSASCLCRWRPLHLQELLDALRQFQRRLETLYRKECPNDVGMLLIPAVSGA